VTDYGTLLRDHVTLRCHPHMDWGREMAFINHFYFYLWDAEWGGAFWKTNSYALSDLALAERT
jgi:hypothetical protein